MRLGKNATETWHKAGMCRTMTIRMSWKEWNASSFSFCKHFACGSWKIVLMTWGFWREEDGSEMPKEGGMVFEMQGQGIAFVGRTPARA